MPNNSLLSDEILELQRRKKFYADNPPIWSLTQKPLVEYTDEDREQFEYDRFVFLNDERQTYA